MPSGNGVLTVGSRSVVPPIAAVDGGDLEVFPKVDISAGAALSKLRRLSLIDARELNGTDVLLSASRLGELRLSDVVSFDSPKVLRSLRGVDLVVDGLDPRVAAE